MIEQRICITCKESKDATAENFYRDKNRKLGLMYRCKSCDKKRPDNRTYQSYVKNMTDEQFDKYKTRQLRYNNSEKGRCYSLLKSYKKYDKSKGYDLTDVTIDYLLDVRLKNCVYCGYKATGLDRLNNSKGHKIDNCVPCCVECNIARMDHFTFDEMKIIGLAIKSVKDSRVI